MSLKTMLEKCASTRKDYEDSLAEVRKTKGDQLRREVAALLGEHIPPGYALQFEGWAPHFNDGDPCVFHVRNEIVFSLERSKDYGSDELITDSKYLKRVDEETTESVGLDGYAVGRYGQEWTNYKGETEPGDPEMPGLSRAALAAIKESFNSVSEDVLQLAFGNSFVVRVESGGKFQVGEPDHY